jgi:predicted transcriptional regulator
VAKARGLSDTAIGDLIGAKQPSVSAVMNNAVGASVLVDRISRVLDIDSPIPLPEDASYLSKLRRLRVHNPRKHETLMRMLDDLLDEGK